MLDQQASRQVCSFADSLKRLWGTEARASVGCEERSFTKGSPMVDQPTVVGHRTAWRGRCAAGDRKAAMVPFVGQAFGSGQRIAVEGSTVGRTWADESSARCIFARKNDSRDEKFRRESLQTGRMSGTAVP